MLALSAVVLAPALAGLLALPPWPDTGAVLAAAAAAHLAVHVLRGGHPAVALLAPPLAWALTLAERVAGPGRRRDWALPLLLGAMTAVTAAVLLALRVLAGAVEDDRAAKLLAGVGGEGLSPGLAVAAACAALLLLAACVRAARRGGLLARLLTVPVWALGAILLLAGALLLLPIALLTGRATALLRLSGRTLTGAVAVARPDRRRPSRDALRLAPELP
jgi:hypothetical protein